MQIKPWIEALRPRTLPVSIAGVLAGYAVAIAYDKFLWLPAIICLVFSMIAQIVSNLANEYYDFKNGIDKKGREGFRRGVTEGDIKPETMKHVLFTLLILDCALGCTLIHWGGLWLIAAGVLIAIAALAYSAGPWPLSHHGLGDELVIIFYGIVPVTLTSYVMCGDWTGGEMAIILGDMWKMALIASLGVGLLADNVLTVNNVRDINDDKQSGKHTKAVIFGVNTMKIGYIMCCVAGLLLIWYSFRDATPDWSWTGYAAAAVWYLPLILAMYKLKGKKLNPVLKFTSIILLVVIVWALGCILFQHSDIMEQSHTSNVILDMYEKLK